MSAPVLRLLADDLTGALDSAAEFAGLCGPVPVLWPACVPPGLVGPAALDAATREAPREVAMARAAALAPALAGAGIAFRKLDSLLRGHVAAELAACLRGGAWRSVVLAPAFPAQGRVTRGLVQHARQPDGAFRPVAPPLPGLLAAEGLSCVAARPGEALPAGILGFDAETEADLAAIVAAGRAAPGPVLWCGSGGLAAALAGVPAPRSVALRPPVLGLFGSDQPATARQLAACGAAALRLHGDGATTRVGDALARRGVALVSPDLPAGLSRAEAARRIAAGFAALLRALPPPGTLVVAGGETLRTVCDALGAQALEATGLVAPGVPRSVLRGGRWDGVAIVSKSGAFGGDGIWRDLLAANGLLSDDEAA